ncbi:MAG: Trm112 family protein [Nitrospiraceae bacterium]|nr:Trm112 family protein [Nitrospiraceae bacterium]
MKEEFIGMMCCPACKGELELKVEKKEGDDIMEGTLTCTNCKASYDIKDGIPYMIVEK